MRGADRAYMRGMLAGSGILLDEPIVASANATPSPRTSPPVDRELIREILMDRGARSSDLAWLTASCPSVRDAEGYRPPPVEAWCVDCGGPQPTDAAGCITCRERNA